MSNNVLVANSTVAGTATFSPGLIVAMHKNTYVKGVQINNNYGDCGAGPPPWFIALATVGSGSVSGSGNINLATGAVLPPLSNDWAHNYTCP